MRMIKIAYYVGMKLVIGHVQKKLSGKFHFSLDFSIGIAP
jgi:hypothetical protein